MTFSHPSHEGMMHYWFEYDEVKSLIKKQAFTIPILGLLI